MSAGCGVHTVPEKFENISVLCILIKNILKRHENSAVLLGNLLCRHWGAYYNVSNVRLQPVTISATEDGQAVYRFTGAEISPNDLLSRWHMQIGARIVF